MPMNWTAEADAKLFLGVLNQLRDAKLKLNNEKLAEFMGPECLPGAVHNRIVRLRRMAEAGCSDGGDANGNSEGGAGGDTGSDTSPLKRKAVRKPRGVGGSKKAKANTAAGSGPVAGVDADEDADSGVKAELQAEIVVKREHEHGYESESAMDEHRA